MGSNDPAPLRIPPPLPGPGGRPTPSQSSCHSGHFAMLAFITSRPRAQGGRASLVGREPIGGSGAAHAPGTRDLRVGDGPLLTARPPSSSRTLRGKKGGGGQGSHSGRGGPARDPGTRRALPLINCTKPPELLAATGEKRKQLTQATPSPTHKTKDIHAGATCTPATSLTLPRPSPSKSMRPSLFLSPSFIRDSISSSVTCSPEALKISASSSASM